MLKKIIPLCLIAIMTSNICFAEMIMPAKNLGNEIIQVEQPTQAYSILNQVRKINTCLSRGLYQQVGKSNNFFVKSSKQ